VQGPTSIKSEEGLLANYVYIDFSGRDVGGYVEEAKKNVEKQVTLPSGYSLQWSGEYEYLLKTWERLKTVIPLTLFIIFVLIYLNTKSTVKTVIILLAVPFLLSVLFASVLAGLQLEYCSRGRHDCACRP